MKELKKAAIVEKILQVLAEENLTVAEAKNIILFDVRKAIESIPFRIAPKVAYPKRQLEERLIRQSTNYLVCEVATECLGIICEKLHPGNFDAVILEMKRQRG